MRPGEENGLPSAPRPYTDIKSYHAHFYFDEDTYEKAALVRKWSAERFPVLGNWNLPARSSRNAIILFRFTNDLLPIIIPWLQLNSLGLTILLPQYGRPQGGPPVLHALGESLTTGKCLRHEEARARPASRRADPSEYEAYSQAGSLTCACEGSARGCAARGSAGPILATSELATSPALVAVRFAVAFGFHKIHKAG